MEGDESEGKKKKSAWANGVAWWRFVVADGPSIFPEITRGNFLEKIIQPRGGERIDSERVELAPAARLLRVAKFLDPRKPRSVDKVESSLSVP